MEWIPDWQELLVWSGAFSAGAMVATLVGVPWVVGRLPRDYFLRDRRRAWYRIPGAPVYSHTLALLKNLLGLVLLALGVVLLFVPGQGLLTMLVGLMLINFPGKYRAERWLVRQESVMRGLNWVRHRRGQPPFDLPPEVGNGPDLPRD